MAIRYQVIIFRVASGGVRYAHFIEKEVNLAGYCCASIRVKDFESFAKKAIISPQETIIHARTANQEVYRFLKKLETKGFRCINQAETILRTSDKYYSSQLALKNKIPSPRSFRVRKKGIKSMVLKKIREWGKVIVKPTTSFEQGAWCFLFDRKNASQAEVVFKKIPKDNFVVQEWVDYQRLYRLVVIGDKAVKVAFYDEPQNDWKASVCLNQKIKVERKPSTELVKFAEKTARVFGSEIGFIDIFQTKQGFVLNEINTACNLAIHERKSGVNFSKLIADYLINQLPTSK